MLTRDTIDEDFPIVDAVGIFYLIHLFTNQSQRTEEKKERRCRVLTIEKMLTQLLELGEVNQCRSSTIKYRIKIHRVVFILFGKIVM